MCAGVAFRNCRRPRALPLFFSAFDVEGVYFKDVRSTGGETVQSARAVAFDFEAREIRFIGLGGGKLKAHLARNLDYLARHSPNAIEAASRGLGPMASILVNGRLRDLVEPEKQRTKVKAIEW